jgi:hypothetical protein
MVHEIDGGGTTPLRRILQWQRQMYKGDREARGEQWSGLTGLEERVWLSWWNVMLLEGKHEVEQLSQTKSKREENWAPLMLQPPRYPRGCPPRRSHLSIWSKDTASQSTSGMYYGTRGIFCMWAECTGVCTGVAQTVLYFSKLCMTGLTTLPHTIY